MVSTGEADRESSSTAITSIVAKKIMAARRKIIVNIATSADGFIARPDGDLDWLTNRPPPKGFYGFNEFISSIDAKVLGRKTFDVSLKMGAKFDSKTPHYVFTRKSPPKSLPAGVEFVSEEVGTFAKSLRAHEGKHVWLMGGGELIASFLDAGGRRRVHHQRYPDLHRRRTPADCAEAPRRTFASELSDAFP